MISRGDIRWFRFEAPDKRRPVLVLGREEILSALTHSPVIPISTQITAFPDARWSEVMTALPDVLGLTRTG